MFLDQLLKIKREQKNLNKHEIKYIYRLDKVCFQHDMAYGSFKDLNTRTIGDKVLRDKTFNIAKDPKYDGYKRRLTSIFDKYFDRKLLEELLKIRIFLIKN